jgi:hypothetical protein
MHSRRQRSFAPAIESLELRALLAGYNGPWTGLYDLEVAGRAGDGTWWATGFDLPHEENSTDPTAPQHDEVFAKWNPAAHWQNVRSGDFDGDGMSDIAGWDASSGDWWVSLADMTGSTTVRAAHWSTGTAWSDIAAADLASHRDRVGDGHFTHKSDLVGRDQWGHWWGAISNGDGTFTTQLLANWSAATVWHDVRVGDINGDLATDIVGRDDWGNWWATRSVVGSDLEGLTYQTAFLGSWSPSAKWQDVLFVADYGKLLAPYPMAQTTWPAIVGRANDGTWWAMEFRSGEPITSYAGWWSPSVHWQDVTAADLDGDGTNEIVGRTTDGQWWRGTSNPMFIGSWYEVAGWQDVRAVHGDSLGRYVFTDVGGTSTWKWVVGDMLIGRTSDGTWWGSRLAPTGATLESLRLGVWNEAAGWHDVHAGHLTRDPVASRSVRAEEGAFHLEIDIRGNRHGTTVEVHDEERLVTFPPEIPHRPPLIVVYVDRVVNYTPAGGETQRVPSQVGVFPSGTPSNLTPTSITFVGHYGIDDFKDLTLAASTARGMAGDDKLDAQDGHTNWPADALFGGDGLDKILGDPGEQQALEIAYVAASL